MTSTLYFHGGAGSVTGSNFLLDTGAQKVMIDCGLEQGSHTCEESNWEPFPFNPSEVKYLLITHAHIDHIGRIPKLVKDGFTGVILSTSATKTLAAPMLEDAQEILQHAASACGKPQLYGSTHIDQALGLWQTLEYHQQKELGDDVTAELLNSGHILGSAMVKFSRGSKTLVVTGDLGGGNSPLLAPHESPTGVEYLVMESVYGDRVRGDDANRKEKLENIIEETIARGGTLLIPAFSTERTQDLLFEIRSLMTEKRVPSVPVYLDSPLAQKITGAFMAHPDYFAPDIAARVKAGEDIFSFPELHYVQTMEDSHKIHANHGPKIILAGSGMSNGGRVIAHEQVLLPDQKSTLLIVGYQSAGSLGRRLVEGEKTVTLFKEKVPVRAKVESLYGYSAHMDSEQLLEFANQVSDSVKEIFVVEGEPAAAAFLTQRLRDYVGLRAQAPERGEKVTLEL